MIREDETRKLDLYTDLNSWLKGHFESRDMARARYPKRMVIKRKAFGFDVENNPVSQYSHGGESVFVTAYGGGTYLVSCSPPEMAWTM